MALYADTRKACRYHATSIYGVELLVGPLYRALRSTAPGLELAVLPWTGALATTAARHALVTRAPPIVVPGFEVGVAWHTRRDDDLATAHVREHITRIVASLPPRARPPGSQKPS